MPEPEDKIEVTKQEDEDGAILTIEFSGQAPALKAGINRWLLANYPEMTMAQFFDKIVEYRPGYCRISMV